MNLEVLKNNDTIKKIVNDIINNKDFSDKCEESFKEIYRDNKLDEKDIPLLINLLMTVYLNYNNIKIGKKHIKRVLILLIITLIEKYQDCKTINNELLIQLIEPQIDLLLFNFNIPKCKFCSSRPIDEDKLINNIKYIKNNNHSEEI